MADDDDDFVDVRAIVDEEDGEFFDVKRGDDKRLYGKLINVHAPVKYNMQLTTPEAIRRINRALTLYDVLNLPKTATTEAITKEYRILSLKVHPDKTREPGAEQAFKRLANAYHVLADARQRALYDRGKLTITSGIDKIDARAIYDAVERAHRTTPFRLW